MTALAAPVRALSATEALLACAAACTETEMHLARLALIATGKDVLRDLDRGGVFAGDGTAGRHLLGGTGYVTSDSAAMRSTRLQVRLLGALVRNAVLRGGDLR